jgi:hypothetical protein
MRFASVSQITFELRLGVGSQDLRIFSSALTILTVSGHPGALYAP